MFDVVNPFSKANFWNLLRTFSSLSRLRPAGEYGLNFYSYRLSPPILMGYSPIPTPAWEDNEMRYRRGDTHPTPRRVQAGLTVQFHGPVGCLSYWRRDIYDGIGLVVSGHNRNFFASWEQSKILDALPLACPGLSVLSSASA